MTNHIRTLISIALLLFLPGITGAQNDSGAALLSAVERGDIQEVRTLLAEGVFAGQSDGQGYAALHFAAGHRSKSDISTQYELKPGLRQEMVALLLSYGANVNATTRDGVTPLFHAAHYGYDDIVKQLINAGANVNARESDGGTALLAAAGSRHEKSALLLVDAGADINIGQFGGATALLAASWSGSEETAELLLSRGADANRASADAITPLMAACSHGFSTIALRLIEKGAQVNTTNRGNATPLHCAGYIGSLELARQLLDRGATITARDVAGETPLHLAAFYGHVEVADLLLERGADVNAKDEDGNTPLHAAEVRKNDDLARLLVSRGATPTGSGASALPRPEMTFIPAGSFGMGGSGDRRVQIKQSFALGTTEVTQGLWKAVMGSNPSAHVECGDQCPVENVTLDEIQKFLNRLSFRTGVEFRLPSDKEWEYACHAGHDDLYCGGNSPGLVGWFSKNTGDSTFTDETAGTQPVGQLMPNAWGLYDMSGNVAEVTRNCPRSSAEDEPTDVVALYESSCQSRVSRGGSYSNGDDALRATTRNRAWPYYPGTDDSYLRDKSLGLRLASTSDIAYAGEAPQKPNRPAFILPVDAAPAELTDARASSALTPRLIAQVGHPSAVRYGALTADGKYLLSVGRDHAVKLWDVGSALELGTLQADAPAALALSPTDSIYAMAETDGSVSIWSLTDHRLLQRLLCPSIQVRENQAGAPQWQSKLTFSSDGQVLAARLSDGSLAIWEVTGGHLLGVLPSTGKPPSSIEEVAISADDKQLISLSGTQVTVWSIGAAQPVRTFQISTGPFENAAALSADGTTLALGDLRGGALWNVVSGLKIGELSGLDSSIQAIAFSPGGDQIALATLDHTIRIWDVSSLHEQNIISNHGSEIAWIAFSHDGNSVLSSSGDDTAVYRWDVITGTEIGKFEGYSAGTPYTEFSADGKSLLLSTMRAGLFRWDLSGVTGPIPDRESAATLTCTVLSADGRMLVTGDARGRIRVWDVSSDKEITTIKASSLPVLSLAISSDNRSIAVGGEGPTIKVWDLRSGVVTRSLAGHKDRIRSLAFSSDGSWLLSGGDDRLAVLWNLETGARNWSVRRTREYDYGVRFGPGDRTVIATSGQLWDAKTGRELHSQSASGWSDDFAVSPDGATVAAETDTLRPRCESDTACNTSDISFKTWDIRSGKEIKTYDVGIMQQPRYSKDGRTIIGRTNSNESVALVDVKTGKLRGGVEYKGNLGSVAVSSDCRFVLAPVDETQIALWDAEAGKEIKRFVGHGDDVLAIAISRDDSHFVSASRGGRISLWDIATGAEIRSIFGLGRPATLFGPIGGYRSVSFAGVADGLIAARYDSGIIKLWNAYTGAELQATKSIGANIIGTASSRNGETTAELRRDGSLVINRVRERSPGQSVTDVGYHEWPIAVSDNGTKLAFMADDNHVGVMDVRSGGTLRTLEFKRGHFAASVTLSPDDRHLAVCGGLDFIEVFDLESGDVSNRLAGHSGFVEYCRYTPDGSQIVSAAKDGTIRVWDAHTGRALRTVVGAGTGATLSRDGRLIAAGAENGAVYVWDVSSGDRLQRLAGLTTNTVDNLTFSPDGKILASTNSNGEILLYDVKSGQLLATLATFGDGQWAVTDPEGRFDSSNAGEVPGLHWVVGVTPLPLSQLKNRYFDPGLLAKILGLSPEPLRTVPNLEDAVAHLFPAVQARIDPDAPGKLLISLRDQGGGYGPVRVRLNGKELTADARGAGKLSGDSITLPPVLIAPDLLDSTQNVLDVVAWNTDGSLSSPPFAVRIGGSRGGRAVAGATTTVPHEVPSLYAIVVGTAHFRDSSMDLTFSGKDAYDFAQAIGLGAKRLFGTDQVHMHLLSDYAPSIPVNGGPSMTSVSPSRENLEQAFTQVAKDARPGDILVVFLAGHGVMSVGADGDYYYLTNDAAGLDLTDPAVRRLWGVSSSELTDWIKSIRAGKQMMVLDTCSSGGALEKLTQRRAVPSSQIIALDRLKDRTGFYVLAGAAADRVSYETSRFGQGLLTRALLTGMKGAALRDGEFVDVARLFQYARDEVPSLAKDIGGIQSPIVAAPSGDSFDVGEMLDEERQAVPLAPVREMILPALFQDEEQMADVQRLSSRFNQRLRAENAVAARGHVAFIDADDFPDAWRVAGRYTKTSLGLEVGVRLFRSNQLKSAFKVVLRGTEAEQIDSLFSAVMAKVEPGEK